MSAETFEMQGIPALATPVSGKVDAWVKDIIKRGTGLEDPAKQMAVGEYARMYRAIKSECTMVLQVPEDAIKMCERRTA